MAKESSDDSNNANQEALEQQQVILSVLSTQKRNYQGFPLSYRLEIFHIC